MKYRRLTKQELKELETEFVRFLVANTVTGEDWEKTKKEKPEEAEKLIDIFSDIAMEKSLQKIEYLEFRSLKDIKTFHFQKEKIVLIGLNAPDDSPVDFTKEDPKPADKLKIYTASKAYLGEREKEIFDMLHAGALISKDGSLFKLLEKLIAP